MAEIGKIAKREIVQEMRESYLDYAMSVIVARALPDVRDGLKPVQRRILYTLEEMGLTHNAKFRKSAAIVGDCLGKYHPHGDMAVYDALARMAQDFSLRYPLVDGQGNFGSIDGDPPAAQRYTEARLTRIAEELLKDIDKDTVDFRENYDATRKEPVVLPAAVPSLLLNGSVGIAVGMATSIPPHNLGEVMDSLIHLVNHPEATGEDLMEFIHGPDFPTGGIIYNFGAIRQAYASGHGAILTRAKAEIIEKSGHGRQIVITEIPYQVVKSDLISKIADLVKEKRIEGIRDLRDESDKEGLCISIDLKADAVAQKVLNNLFKLTDLEKNFNLNMLALIDGIQPKVLPLKGVLEEFLKHREIVTTRRARFDLTRAKERAHILEGLSRALDEIDRVIQTIKQSRDRAEAYANLIKRFKFSEAQTNAILEMKLQTLAGLERQKIEDELKEKLGLIRELETLLKDRKKILAQMQKEFADIKTRYADPRKTTLVKSALKEFSTEDLIPEENAIILLTRGGYVKRMKPENYRVQRRGGKGIAGVETNAEDVVEHFLLANTHADLFFFTSSGKIYQTKVYDIPEASRTAKGKAIVNFLAVGPQERITSVLAATPASKKTHQYLSMATKDGIIKKVEATLFRRSGVLAIQLKSGDELRWVRASAGKDEFLLVTKLGSAIRFRESEVRSMSRTASGVKAVRLKKGDEVIGLSVIASSTTAAGSQPRPASSELLVVTERGFAKKTSLSQYKRQKRGGSGVKTAKLTEKNGPIVASRLIGDEEELIAVSKKGQVIRTELSAVPTSGRMTQGVRIMKLDDDDRIASVTLI